MEKKHLLTVSEVAKILDVNKNTILHYDREGLVKSIRMDNNYRYYHEAQIENFKIIISLRKIGFSVKEIKNMKDSFKNQNYKDIIEMVKRREKEFEEERENLEKERKALISHKKWLEFLNNSTEVSSLDSELEKYRFLEKEEGIFCIKEYKEEKAIYIDIENTNRNLFEHVSKELKIYNCGKEWWEKYLFGYAVSKNDFEKLNCKKSKLIIKINIELFPNKYIFPKGKYAVFYVPIDTEEKEAVKCFYSKIIESNYEIISDLYIENIFIFGNPDIKRSKVKVLKTFVKSL